MLHKTNKLGFIVSIYTLETMCLNIALCLKQYFITDTDCFYKTISIHVLQHQVFYVSISE